LSRPRDNGIFGARDCDSFEIDFLLNHAHNLPQTGKSRSDLVLGRTSFFPNYAAPSASARLLDFNTAFFATNRPAKELRTCEKTTNHSTVTTISRRCYNYPIK
jgi:hypothetical protein